MGAGCEIVREDYKDLALELSERTVVEDREFAVTVCEDGSHEVFEGENGEVEYDRCDEGELLNMHTHPPLNVPRPSKQDLKQVLKQHKSDKTDKMCVIGSSNENPTVACTSLDRSGMSDEEYEEFAKEVDEFVEETADILDLPDEYEFMDSCQITLERES